MGAGRSEELGVTGLVGPDRRGGLESPAGGRAGVWVLDTSVEELVIEAKAEESLSPPFLWPLSFLLDLDWGWAGLAHPASPPAGRCMSSSQRSSPLGCASSSTSRCGQGRGRAGGSRLGLPSFEKALTLALPSRSALCSTTQGQSCSTPSWTLCLVSCAVGQAWAGPGVGGRRGGGTVGGYRAAARWAQLWEVLGPVCC